MIGEWYVFVKLERQTNVEARRMLQGVIQSSTNEPMVLYIPPVSTTYSYNACGTLFNMLRVVFLLSDVPHSGKLQTGM